MRLRDGTGTQTHTWSRTGADDLVSAGANFVQVEAGGAAVLRSGGLLMMGVG